MDRPGLRPRVQAAPIRLRPDRFEALVSAHEAFLLGRPGGRRAALQFVVASGYSCDGRRLVEARFDGADFSRTSFRRTDFTRASLYCANLADCDLSEARL